jgi:hypothetical protein
MNKDSRRQVEKPGVASLWELQAERQSEGLTSAEIERKRREDDMAAVLLHTQMMSIVDSGYSSDCSSDCSSPGGCK